MEKTEWNKKDLYKLLKIRIGGLLDSSPYRISNLANTSAMLMEWLPDINWVGFYIRKQDQLILGPFQGKTACTRIQMGKGVCGTAAVRDAAILVEDVHAFPGHIACDSASRSEIVIPVHCGGEVWGVLDIDSPSVARFDSEDQEGLEALVRILEERMGEELN